MPKPMLRVRANLNELSGTFIMGIVLLGFIVLTAIFFSPDHHILIALITLPGLFLMLAAAVLGLISGRAGYWFLFVCACLEVLGVIFLMALPGLLGIQNTVTMAFFCISLIISCLLSWRWGAGIYNAETMKGVLASRRIDIQNGTYSPFTLPGEVFNSKGSKKWFLIASASGPLLITSAIIFSKILGRYTPDLQRLWGGLWGYIVIVLFVGCIRAALGEYGWIRRWEKETDRKMYISYVVEWRRYKEKNRRDDL